MVQVVPKHDPSDKAVGATIDRLRSNLPAGCARRRLGRREPRPRSGAHRQDPAGHRRGPRARLPAAARRAAGADPRRRRRGHQPARRRRRVRRRPAHLPGGPPRRPARPGPAGLPERLGARVLLRDGLRHLDGLHGVPALLRQGALGPQPRPARGDGRRRRPLRPRRVRRRGGDGRRVLHLRPVRPAAAQGDGRDPRHRRPARRRPRPPAARPGRAAAARQVGVVAAQAAGPRPARRPLRPRLELDVRPRRKHTLDLSRTLARAASTDACSSYDVREGDERAQSFVPGSRHLPLGQVKGAPRRASTRTSPSPSSARPAGAPRWPPPRPGARVTTPTTSTAA